MGQLNAAAAAAAGGGRRLGGTHGGGVRMRHALRPPSGLWLPVGSSAGLGGEWRRALGRQDRRHITPAGMRRIPHERIIEGAPVHRSAAAAAGTCMSRSEPF